MATQHTHTNKGNVISLAAHRHEPAKHAARSSCKPAKPEWYDDPEFIQTCFNQLSDMDRARLAGIIWSFVLPKIKLP